MGEEKPALGGLASTQCSGGGAGGRLYVLKVSGAGRVWKGVVVGCRLWGYSCARHNPVNTDTMTTSHTGIADAVRAAGSQNKLAAQLGVTQQAVSAWMRRGWVPLQRAVEIETQLGVPRARLINPRIVDVVDSEGGEV